MSEIKADAAAPFCPAPDSNPHPPHPALPAGATDCHAHVFKAACCGYQNERSYTRTIATSLFQVPWVFGALNTCSARSRTAQAAEGTMTVGRNE